MRKHTVADRIAPKNNLEASVETTRHLSTIPTVSLCSAPANDGRTPIGQKKIDRDLSERRIADERVASGVARHVASIST